MNEYGIECISQLIVHGFEHFLRGLLALADSLNSAFIDTSFLILRVQLGLVSDHGALYLFRNLAESSAHCQ